ncbi:MAG: hypothetical protein ACKOW9_01950 [Candidatus Paceibacterota bacterium]
MSSGKLSSKVSDTKGGRESKRETKKGEKVKSILTLTDIMSSFVRIK